MTMTDTRSEEVLAQLRAETPKLPWRCPGVFRTDQGQNSYWELEVRYTASGGWLGGLWYRPSGCTTPVTRLASTVEAQPVAALHSALAMLDEWQKDIFSTLTVARLKP